MGIVYLILLFILSVGNLVYLTVWYRKQQNNYIFYLFVAVVVANFGHLLLGLSQSVEGAVIANKVNYLGASFLPLFMLFTLLKICKIRMTIPMKTILVVCSVLLCCAAMSVGYSDVYYTSVGYVTRYGIGNYEASFGWAHNLFNIMLVAYVVADFLVICYAAVKSKEVSFQNIKLMALLEVISIVSFVVSRTYDCDTIVMPLVYVLDQILILHICSTVKWYDISYSVLEALEANNDCAYVSFSAYGLYLGCNDIAERFFPSLKSCRIDGSLKESSEMGSLFNPWLRKLKNKEHLDGFEDCFNFDYADKHYKCNVKALRPVHGEWLYLFKIVDDTEICHYVETLDESNAKLLEAVSKNTNKMKSLKEQIVLCMAEMVENRDDNTGGHMKRTSGVVKILVSKMREEKALQVPDQFYDVLISVASMHDLGKVAIDDQILRKPGRFSLDEYNIMKSHAEKGAAIVENLLTGLEDPYFVQMAKNVALYHHERWDGNGYPMGLKKEEIPLESRIMAVADVYDALVSKRCYKRQMSFEDADQIISASMGIHFDPNLRKYYEESRDMLVEFYRSMDR